MAIIHSNGSTNVTITDIQTTSDREINYAKTSSGTYIWTRPTAIDLQFPWDAFSSWAITRMAGSKYPGVTQGLVWYNGSKTTSGTNTYSFSNVYYGDKLKFSYTAKPGAIIDQENNYEFTVDPTFSISNINAEKSELPDPTAKLSSQWDFKEGTWSTVKANGNRHRFSMNVKRAESLKNVEVKLYAKLDLAEAFYRKNLCLITYESTSAGVDVELTDVCTGLSKTEYTYIGKMSAGGDLEKTIGFYVTVSDAKYAWPKGIKMTVKAELASTDHYFTSSSRATTVLKGTFTSTGGGQGPYIPGGGGGFGGTGYGSKW